MKLFRYLNVAVESILAHKMRAILTMLGIIIGVASVVLTVGLGQGAAKSITEDIESEGANLLTINAGFETENTLTLADVERLANPALHPEIDALMPEYSAYAIRLVHKDTSIEVQVTGTTANYTEIRNLYLAQGRFFTAAEVESQRQVVVLSSVAAGELFNSANPIGQLVQVNNELLQVVGVLAEGGGGFSAATDRRVFVPLDLALYRLFDAPLYRGVHTLTEVSVQVTSRELLIQAEYNIERTLRLLHNLGSEDKNDFMIVNQGRLLKMVNGISQTLTLLLGSIGAVSLLVGGIGIMNIMLVSVTERTREIGLRKALGAHDGDILRQFLIEALVLTTLGGTIGMGLSYGVGLLVEQIPDTPFQVVIEANVLLLALGVSLCCGFVFGLYPAIRATRLDPIEALRYE